MPVLHQHGLVLTQRFESELIRVSEDDSRLALSLITSVVLAGAKGDAMSPPVSIESKLPMWKRHPHGAPDSNRPLGERSPHQSVNLETGTSCGPQTTTVVKMYGSYRW